MSLSSRASRSAALLALCLLGGCPAPIYYQATTGRTYPGESERKAAFESAAYDLRCGSDSISVLATSYATDSWVAAMVPTQLEGCGQHVTYQVRCGRDPPDDHFVCHYALAGRTPIAAPATTPAGAGCSKDTDCKGDRVCVQGQCADPVKPTPSPTTP
jgi:hypothetical protein